MVSRENDPMVPPENDPTWEFYTPPSIPLLVPIGQEHSFWSGTLPQPMDPLMKYTWLFYLLGPSRACET